LRAAVPEDQHRGAEAELEVLVAVVDSDAVAGESGGESVLWAFGGEGPDVLVEDDLLQR
jgi:hypothetical protein